MAAPGSEEKSLTPEIRAILEDAVGPDMANRIIIGSCNILSVEEADIYGEEFDRFLMRLEMVIPNIVGLRPGEAVIERLRRLKIGTGA